MKTNVNMVRKMGDFDVTQRTKDGMFNATLLLKQWNLDKNMNKSVNDFLKLKQTKQYIEVLCDDFKDGESPALKTRGKKASTWMHPYLFIDFAMWINPKFKLQVVKFVYDQLIKNRHDAGDNYNVLSRAGARLKGYNYSEVATALNYIVFNKKEKGLRNSATEEQLKELSELESNLAFSINNGLIKSYKLLVDTLRNMWSEKHQPIKVA